MVLAAGSALLFLLLLLIAAYFALQSPWFYDKLKPELIARLQPLGIELEDPGSLRLDLLRGFSLRHARLIWHDDALGDARLSIGEFDFGYALTDLIKGRAVIKNLSLRNAQVKANIRSPSSADDSALPEPMTLAQVEDLLKSAPLPLEIKHIELDDIQLDLRLDNGQQWQQLRGHIQHASANALWQSDLFQGQLTLAADQPWMLQQGNANQSEVLEFIAALETNLQWDLAMPDAAWRLHQLAINHRSPLQQIKLSRIHEKQRSQLGTADALELIFNGQVQSAATNVQEHGLAGIFPLELDSRLDTRTSGLSVKGFEEDQFKLDLGADHQLAVEVQGRVNPFDTATPPLSLTTHQTLKVAALEAELPGQRASTENLNVTLDSSSDLRWRETLTPPLDFQLELAGQAQSFRWLQAENATGAKAIDASMSPRFKLSANGVIDSLDNLLQNLTLNFAPEFNTSRLAIELSSGKLTEHYRAGNQSLSATGQLTKGQLRLVADLGLANARIPQLLRKFSVENHIDLKTDLDLKEPVFGLQTVLDKKPLADIQLQIKNQTEKLTLHHQIHASLTRRLKKLHAAASALETTGDLEINSDGNLTLQHGANNLLAADFNQLSSWPFEQRGNLSVTQTRRPKRKDGIQLTAPVKTRYSISSDNGSTFNTALHTKAPGIKAGPLVRPMPLELWHQAEFDWPLEKVETNATMNIAGSKAVSFQMTADNRPRQLAIDSRWSLSPKEKWKKYLPALAALSNVGGVTIAHWLKGKVTHPSISILDLSAKQIERMRAKLTLDTHITQSPGKPGSMVKLSAPVDLSQTLEWSGKTAEMTGQFKIASAEASEQVGLESLSGNFTIGANSGLNPDGGTVEIQITEGELLLRDSGDDQTLTTNLKEVLVPLKLNVTARQDEERLHVDDFRLQTGGDFLDWQASGEISLDGKEAQITSTLETRLRPDLLVNPYLGGAGSASVPWHLVMLDGRQVSIDGQVRFHNLDLTTKTFQLQGLDGGMRIEEELLWTGEQLRYRYLENPDPFQRVDFTRVQPFLDNRETLRVQEISAGDKKLGPGLASLQLKQNVLHLQQLELDLFGGHLTGQIYLDTRPGNWKIGLLSRITQVDPRQLLAKDSPGRTGEYAPVSARTALEFDIRQRLLEGRIDMTKISREQLFQLLEIIDPDYQDEQISQLRSALRLAYPQKLTIEMQQGLLNLEARISALPEPLTIRGLPLTPLIQHFAGPALEALGKIPLQ